MPLAGNYIQITVLVDFVDKPICIVNAPRPAVTITKFFGLADASINTVAFNVLNQGVNFVKSFAVFFISRNIFVPSFVVSTFIHWHSPQ